MSRQFFFDRLRPSVRSPDLYRTPTQDRDVNHARRTRSRWRESTLDLFAPWSVRVLVDLPLWTVGRLTLHGLRKSPETPPRLMRGSVPVSAEEGHGRESSARGTHSSRSPRPWGRAVPLRSTSADSMWLSRRVVRSTVRPVRQG